MPATVTGPRRSRRPRAGALVVALVAVAVAVVWAPWRSVTEEIGLMPEHAFVTQLGGPLYAARSLHDQDGAPDVAYLSTDAPLTVRVRAAESRGIARLAIRVDGGLAAERAMRCGPHGCPRAVTARFAPAIVARGPGRHRVAVVATASAGGGRVSATVARFDVNVADVASPTLEVEPRRPAPAAPLTHRNPAADAIVRAAAAHGVLTSLLGRSRLVLRDSGRGSGVVTVLADVRPARQNVTAMLAQLDDGRRVQMTAARLGDLMLDVDVGQSRVVGVQPGPGSQVTAWKAPAGAGGRPGGRVTEDERLSGAFTPSHPPRLVLLSDHGPSIFTQDGDPTVRTSARDWPVSLIFTGGATIAKVKAGMRDLGLVRTGHARFLGYRTAGGLVRFDGDHGLKNICDAAATDLHVRLYAPTATDTFLDPKLGHVVAATVHLDHRDGCGVGPQEYGFSERAERRLALLIGDRLGWQVIVDEYPLGNAEPLRRDAADPSHVWQSDGLATGVVVP
jgi:hypothetical protein